VVPYAFFTSRGATGIGFGMDWRNEMPNDDMDVTPDGSEGILVMSDGAGGHQLTLVTDPWPNVDPGLVNGPVLVGVGKPIVAIAADGTEAAMEFKKEIRIYGIPGFSGPVVFPVGDVVDMAFRPH